MANLTRRDIATLETYLQMEGGHLLDFSHRTLANFFDDYGIDIDEEQYQVGSGSKANRMRGFWQFSDEKSVGTVLLGMIDYYDEKRSNSYYMSQEHNDDLRTRCLDIANRLRSGAYSHQGNSHVRSRQNQTPFEPNVNNVSSGQGIQHSIVTNQQLATLHSISKPFVSSQQAVQPSEMQRVFIVHGHDDVLRLEVENFIRTVGLKPIVLMNQASGGSTIIEKIEEYGEADYAIVLYTPCDEGRKKGEQELRGRARQNVVFEHGYFIARLGRQRVSAMVKAGVEIQNDIQGVVYIGAELDWRTQLLKEFKKANLAFDANALFA
ncbi:nucleotide-binding protein [Vibrio brasiliensis]|uniref:TIR domain-containing protein n=1 Tax=Vibrio brasiliensis TaxID=170652 RepID=UPI001EFCBACE|nr:nucleotide-binding protein [Vibrio brasiliensis]MCG9749877.1 nucleotide-binding protein [Vibrio brasiliensis]